MVEAWLTSCSLFIVAGHGGDPSSTVDGRSSSHLLEVDRAFLPYRESNPEHPSSSFSPETGQFFASEIRLGSRGDSYYEVRLVSSPFLLLAPVADLDLASFIQYLIKQYLQTVSTLSDLSSLAVSLTRSTAPFFSGRNRACVSRNVRRSHVGNQEETRLPIQG